MNISKGKIFEKRKEYRDKNADRIKEQKRLDYLKNSEAIKEKRRKYVSENYDIERQRQREYYQRTKKERYKQIKEWQRKNPEKYKQLKRVGVLNRVARKKNASGRYTIHDIQKMYEGQNGQCNACQCSILNGYHVDHRIPLVRGGNNLPSNLQLLCPHCNLTKHTKTMDEFMIMRNK